MTSRGTTPTYILTLPEGTDLSEASAIFVTFATPDYKTVIQKTGTELSIDGNTIEVFLTQEETLSFPVGDILVQVNFTYQEGSVTKRAATTIVKTSSVRNLINEVI